MKTCLYWFLSLLMLLLASNLILAQKTDQHLSKIFIPGQPWLDTDGLHINAHGGGILYYNSKYFWYGEHKIAGSSGNTAMVGVSCYSSSDLLTWKNEGTVLKVEENNTESEIQKGCVIERPKVVYNKKTNKLVMWFHLELKDKGYEAARTGVAISDNPSGPFTYLRSYRPNKENWPVNYPEKLKIPVPGEDTLKWWTNTWMKAVTEGLFVRRDFKEGQMSRDMTVFVDDDGKAYHIHSSEENLSLHISELTDDYLSFTGKWGWVFPGGHNEAPALCKYNGKYYMITSGCTGWDPNAARSAVANSIWGPWELLGNPCRGEGAETTFNSQSTYILKIEGLNNAFIFMADRWVPKNPIEGKYVWLPLSFEKNKPILNWHNQWNFSIFGIEEPPNY